MGFLGDNYQVRLTTAQDSLFIQRSGQDRTFFTVAHEIHVLRGFKSGRAYTAWAVMYDVSCLAMVIFALTGLLMWVRIRKNCPYGLWYLVAGLVIPLSIIFLFMFWK
ncbi:MAG: PepSY-associated TM helix domain-containing protein [Bacteroidota bacterium]